MNQMKNYIVTMSDGSVWAIPIEVIAKHKAKSDFERSVQDYEDYEECLSDVKSLFDNNPYEVCDWASNNMNWDEVQSYAKMIKSPDPSDYQEDWVNGEWKIGT